MLNPFIWVIPVGRVWPTRDFEEELRLDPEIDEKQENPVYLKLSSKPLTSYCKICIPVTHIILTIIVCKYNKYNLNANQKSLTRD